MQYTACLFIVLLKKFLGPQYTICFINIFPVLSISVYRNKKLIYHHIWFNMKDQEENYR